MANDCSDEVLVRLRKIEGQIRGLQKLLSDRADCAKIIQQLCAARKALDKVGFLILSHKMKECVETTQTQDELQRALKEAEDIFLTMA